MTPANTRAAILFVGLMAVAVGDRQVEAQRPERRPHAPESALGGASRSEWQVLVYDGCRFAVPESWRSIGDESVVSAVDGRGSISVRKVRTVDWSRHKAQIREAFGFLKIVHEDSDRRFWFEIGDESRITHYVAIHAGAVACVGLVEARAGAARVDLETTTRVIESIGLAPIPAPREPK